ncbi:MAG TPA: hypothetical protein VGC72_08635 [Candidatus Elarobacter sp.]|jgi:hypothetical protein
MNDDTQPSDDPRLNYKSQTKTQINADYFAMPGGAQIVLVDATSGTVLEGGTILDSGGDGKVSYAIDDSTPGGAYFLAAQDAAGEELAQTMEFFISKDDDF